MRSDWSADSVFGYRTAELHGANANLICVGLTAEWLTAAASGTAAERMQALGPASERNAFAAARHRQYETNRYRLESEGADPAEADLAAMNDVLRRAGLDPEEVVRRHRFTDPASLSSLLRKVTREGATHVLGLFFAEGGAHSVATRTSDGLTTLFDPNHGEFTVRASQAQELFEALANRYRHPDGLNLSTITAQAMR
jgi:YopT-type cysteine protease-like protein